MPAEEVFTAEEFDASVLHSDEEAVVLFLAEWCGYCSAFRPSFERAAEDGTIRFVIARLDDEDSRLWDEYDVQVVPTLAHFRAGTLADRHDGRLAQGISTEEFEAFLRRVRGTRGARG